MQDRLTAGEVCAQGAFRCTWVHTVRFIECGGAACEAGAGQWSPAIAQDSFSVPCRRVHEPQIWS